MLDGVTPVPPDFAARYTERGYWEDRPLFEGFTGALARYADRAALVDKTGPVSYRELSDRSAHLARILLDLAFGPLDRIIVQLPNGSWGSRVFVWPRWTTCGRSRCRCRAPPST